MEQLFMLARAKEKRQNSMWNNFVVKGDSVFG